MSETRTPNPAGEGFSQERKEEIMTQYVMQASGSDTILSFIPGNEPGMTKKIIIL